MIRTKPTYMGAWVYADAGTAVRYTVCTRSDAVEFTFEGLPHFCLTLEEDALDQCVTAFTEALTAYRAAISAEDDHK